MTDETEHQPAASTAVDQLSYHQDMPRGESEERTRILVVDDDRATVDLVKMYLEREHYQVFAAYDGRTALEMASRLRPSVIVLDWMLPGVDGLTVCEQLRADSDVAIIMLTARVNESDKLVGLTSGADDYLTKPFSPRELAARVGVILRRARGGTAQSTLEAGPIRIDLMGREVFADGKLVSLTRTEFDLLAAFVRQPRRVFTREQLIQLALQDDPGVLPRTVDVHVNNLRRKLKHDGQVDVIGTVFGVGYRLEV